MNQIKEKDNGYFSFTLEEEFFATRSGQANNIIEVPLITVITDTLRNISLQKRKLVRL